MREKIDFNNEWLWKEHDIHSNHSYLPIHHFSFDDSEWTLLNVPHDSSIEGEFSEDNPSGARGGYAPAVMSYYRKRFVIDNKYKDKKFKITFEGVYRNAEVYINEVRLGKYPYGYTTFSYDLTPYIRVGQENILAVRVDNELQPGSRWYSGTGIYRPVYLEIFDRTYIEPDEVIVKTVSCNEEEAVIEAEILIKNTNIMNKEIKVITNIQDKEELIVQDIQNVKVNFNDEAKLKLNYKVKNPSLWCNKNPYLYKFNIELVDNNKSIDNYSLNFGIREIKFDKDNGFMINGHKEILKGVCIHHDNGMLGACAYKDSFERKILIMKEMGANAIRTTHNPEAPVFLDLCDKYGMYVMEEAFDEWTLGKRPRVFGNKDIRVPIFAYSMYFNEWSEKDLSAMIRRDRNHPSIIMWSIGNEIEELRHKEGEVYTKQLVEIVHKNDKTRPATVGCNGLAAINETENPDLVDVCGYNYAEDFYKKDHERKPNRLIIGSETSSSTAFEPRGDYRNLLQETNYGYLGEGEEADPEHQGIQQLNSNTFEGRLLKAEYSWRMHKELNFVAGLFIWTGIDYIGEPTPHIWPSISSYFAPVDRCLLKKDAFYFYKSIWSDEPVLHLVPNWNLPGHEGETISVWCFTNCEKVELFVNGISQGIRELDENKSYHLKWDEVIYVPGEIKAIGICNGKEIVTDVKTAGKADHIEVKADRKAIEVNELVYVTYSIRDKDNNVVTSNNFKVKLLADDSLELLGIDNGLQTNHIFRGDTVETWAGYARAVYRGKKANKNIKISASSENIQPGEDYININ